jgi:hypothetical protein
MRSRLLMISRSIIGPRAGVRIGILILYRDHDELDELGLMYRRALTGCEKALGPDHISVRTRRNYNNQWSCAICLVPN